MKKLCAKQNRRAKQWAKIENFANTSQCVRNLSEFRNGLRIWQGDCEFGNGIANLARWFAKLAKWFAKLAMRNFAKLLKFYVRSEVRNVLCNMASEFRNVANWLPTVCQFRNGCELIANWLPIWQRLPKFLLFLLLFNLCSKICTKLLKLMQENLQKSKN